MIFIFTYLDIFLLAFDLLSGFLFFALFSGSLNSSSLGCSVSSVETAALIRRRLENPPTTDGRRDSLNLCRIGLQTSIKTYFVLGGFAWFPDSGL